MARPQKDGLDYFPLDVDMDQDDKVLLIEAQHGVIGFAVVVKLLMKIYKNSYFYEWTEKEQLLFSKRINADINQVNVIINDCVKWGLFDGDTLETHKILTSKGIQKRYLKASERRQRVEIKEKYLLLDSEEVNDYKNLVIANINDNSKEVNDDINPQSKVKESKVNESKGEERKEEEPPQPPPIPSNPSKIEKIILDSFGETAYKTWFLNTKITEQENEVEIIATSNFIAGMITQKYKDTLEKLCGKKVIIKEK